MKNLMSLLLAAVVLALASWAFWRYLGAEALQVLTLVLLISLGVDNHRLRQRLSRSQSDN